MRAGPAHGARERFHDVAPLADFAQSSATPTPAAAIPGKARAPEARPTSVGRSTEKQSSRSHTTLTQTSLGAHCLRSLPLEPQFPEDGTARGQDRDPRSTHRTTVSHQTVSRMHGQPPRRPWVLGRHQWSMCTDSRRGKAQPQLHHSARPPRLLVDSGGQPLELATIFVPSELRHARELSQLAECPLPPAQHLLARRGQRVAAWRVAGALHAVEQPRDAAEAPLRVRPFDDAQLVAVAQLSRSEHAHEPARQTGPRAQSSDPAAVPRAPEARVDLGARPARRAHLQPQGWRLGCGTRRAAALAAARRDDGEHVAHAERVGTGRVGAGRRAHKDVLRKVAASETALLERLSQREAGGVRLQPCDGLAGDHQQRAVLHVLPAQPAGGDASDAPVKKAAGVEASLAHRHGFAARDRRPHVRALVGLP
mmetsp:Transcript_42083/g.138506  ORF Transcript_42083/g.138506 Transcript_42083/m.138506 type:complete len:424 (-) Transcript_42083:111-1382(-)